ncbi:MAG TPA: hypothetical protein VIT83_05045, partial [Gammaproteobacteria bacterium]
MSLAGCGSGPLDPTATGGVRLEGTRGTDAQGGAPFSISPDGRWLSFAFTVPLPENFDDSQAALARFELDRLGHFRLYDLEGGGVIRPEVSAEAEALVMKGGHPLLGAGCWTDGDLALRTALNGHLRLRPGEPMPAWRPAPANLTLPGCSFPDRRPLKSGDFGPVRLDHRDDGRVVIFHRRSGRQLAVHQPGGLPGMAIQVTFLQLSPDCRRVAYGITDHFGSFVGNTTLYVLNIADGESARALASPAHHVQWAPDGASLFAYAKTSENGASAYAIYQWI